MDGRTPQRYRLEGKTKMSKWWNKNFNKFFGTKVNVAVSDAFAVGLATFLLTNLIWIMFVAIFPNI